MKEDYRTIYVMGSSRDISIVPVSTGLQSFGIKTVILEYFSHIDGDYSVASNSKVVSSCVDINIEILPSGQFKYHINGSELEDNSIFWDKAKLSNPGHPLGFDGQNGLDWYRAREWDGLYNFFRSMFFNKMYNPPNVTRNMIKPFQQKIASDVGFRVPHTHIVTRKHYIQKFYNQHNLLVTKTLNDSNIITDAKYNKSHSVLTTPFSRETLDSADESSFFTCPHYVQQYIDKLYELRIIYIDGITFTFKINSQAHEYTKHDWRYGSDMDIFSPISSNSKIDEKLRNFAHKIGLFSGSFDFIVDRYNDVWFLECNQDGAWVWLDKIVEGEIAKAFANGLKKKFEYS